MITPPKGAVLDRYPTQRVRWGNAVLRCRDITGTTQHVGMALAFYGDSDGCECRPGVRRLAFETGRSERTVERCLTELNRLGWITLVRQPTRSRAADLFGPAAVWQLSTPYPPDDPPPELGVEPYNPVDGDDDPLDDPYVVSGDEGPSPGSGVGSSVDEAEAWDWTANVDLDSPARMRRS